MSNVKFLHYRYVTTDKKGKPTVTARNGATVAYMVGPTGSNYAVAYCGPHDNYSKALGRAKSQGRLLSERYAEASSLTDPKKFIAFMDNEMSFKGYSRGPANEEV